MFDKYDGDGYEDDDMLFYQNNRINKKNAKKKKKGRQGRSHESRERAKENRRIFYLHHPKDPHEGLCVECKSKSLIEDRGDLICGECGLVKEHHIPSFIAYGDPPKGKGYRREVHFQQRLAKLIGIDPQLPEDVVDEIGAEVFTTEFTNTSFGTTMGRKTISKLCKKLKLGNKVPDNWIQIRRRLNYPPFPPEIDPMLLKRARIRFSIITSVFVTTIHVPRGVNKVSILERCNGININYVMAQIFRLESEEVFYKVAKFLPQLTDSKQPMTNNTRWKLIIDEINAKEMFTFTEESTMIKHEFNWEYIRLTAAEIEQHFKFFY